MNLASLLRRSALAYGPLGAVAHGDRTLHTFAQLERRVAAMAGQLTGRFGLVRGDCVALAMHNCPQYVEAMFAAWQAGLTAVPINAKLHPREIEYILSHSGAKLCLATPDLAEPVAALQVAGLRLIDVESTEYEALTRGEPAPVADIDGNDVAWLFFTSGTTGRPKGAMLTHRNLLIMTASYFPDVDTIAAGDCILHAAPMSHGSGQYMLPHIAAGSMQVIPESGGFDAREIFDLTAVHRGMTMFAAPTMVKRMVEHPDAATADTSGLKTIVYGGGPMYVADCKRAMAVLGPKLAQIYGQGESPMTITALSKARHVDVDHPRYEARLASVGMPHTVVDVRVVDDEDRTLPAGEIGEILVRGDTVMRGYWKNPEATATTLRGGWLHTGDVGAMDADGFLTLKDRSKDLVISGGSNIYPREVEEVLLLHPGVAEVAVVGAPHPEWGEEVVAFVVARAGEAPPVEALDRLCLDHIARFKRPKRYRFVSALPKNNYGKVLKTELRRMLDDSPSNREQHNA